MKAIPGKDNTVPVFSLRYRKGDLIVKEGDFGLSIYKVIEGQVEIFSEVEDVEIPLSTIGPGSVIGEMIFLTGKKIERRSASARAVTDVELEVWHPKLLEREYEQMPPIIKHLADQALNRLVRINNFFIKLADERNEEYKKQKINDPWVAKRRYYRKQVDIDFKCRPVSPDSDRGLSGKIKDISLGGAGLEVKHLSNQVFSHKPDDEFIFDTTLPSGKKIDFTGKIISIKSGNDKDALFIGVAFTDLSHHSAKNLGFFLMP